MKQYRPVGGGRGFDGFDRPPCDGWQNKFARTLDSECPASYSSALKASFKHAILSSIRTSIHAAETRLHDSMQ